jgi:uncharacterized membrane protein
VVAALFVAYRFVVPLEARWWVRLAAAILTTVVLFLLATWPLTYKEYREQEGLLRAGLERYRKSSKGSGKDLTD